MHEKMNRSDQLLNPSYNVSDPDNNKKYRVRQRGCSLTHSAHTPPAVHQGMMIWGVKGEPPPYFLGAKSYFFVYLERHVKI